MWWESNPPDPQFGYRPKVHARFLEQTLYLIWKGGASVAINLQIRDAPSKPGAVFDHTGIFYANGAPKPAYRAWRFPFVADAEIVKLVCHPDAMTPDANPLLGPVPGVRGFFLAAGLSLNGFGAAGGIGRTIAEWVIGGEPELDVLGYRASRFGGVYRDPSWAAALRSGPAAAVGLSLGAWLLVYASWQLVHWGPAWDRQLIGDVFFYPVSAGATWAAWRASRIPDEQA